MNHSRNNRKILPIAKFNSFDRKVATEITTDKPKKSFPEFYERKLLSMVKRGVPTKVSKTSYGVIKAYAAHTNKGKFKSLNEDRVTISLNVRKPDSFEGKWPKVSFFGVYDGHAGPTCSEFLKEKLHHYIFQNPSFIECPQEAITSAFQKAEHDFTLLAKETRDRSGSCALVALFVEEMCYVANLGDSRAILCTGDCVYPLTWDHKPSNKKEQHRIQGFGGTLYQAGNRQEPLGPLRVLPGKLSVSRAIGDIDAKLVEFGGIPGVVSAVPEVKSFNISAEDKYLFLGCDGIYDFLSNEDLKNMISENHPKRSVEKVIFEAALQGSCDNLTGVLVTLSKF